jgi:hypothetical protein
MFVAPMESTFISSSFVGGYPVIKKKRSPEATKKSLLGLVLGEPYL